MRAGVWKQRPAGILKRSGQPGRPTGGHRGWIRVFMRLERDVLIWFSWNQKPLES